MGEIIGLDYSAVLKVISLYTTDIKRTFEAVLECHQIVQEYKK